MNKETKVGLLVGLSFIVLFGVILSNQAPDIVAPPEKPMTSPVKPRQTNVQVVRQIEMAPAPEPVDVMADASDAKDPAPQADQPVADEPKVDTAMADASAGSADAPVAEPTALSASHPEGATRAITADELGPETADAEAEPGDASGLEILSTKVAADGTKTTVYIVKPGDNLAKISRQFYGDATNRNIDMLFAANKNKMPNKKTLQVGMKLQVPDKPEKAKDKESDELLSSGKFDEVAELKPGKSAGKGKDAVAAKDAKPAKDGKEIKEAKESPKGTSKDSKKASSKSAVAEATDGIERLLLEHVSAERTIETSSSTTSTTTTTTSTTDEPLAEVVEPAESADTDVQPAKTETRTETKTSETKGTSKTALASRENCKPYQIQKGDTWYKLAAKFMGDSKRWHELCALNNDILPDSSKLRAGVKIRVPAGKGRLDYVVE